MSTEYRAWLEQLSDKGIDADEVELTPERIAFILGEHKADSGEWLVDLPSDKLLAAIGNWRDADMRGFTSTALMIEVIARCREYARLQLASDLAATVVRPAPFVDEFTYEVTP